MLPYNTIEAIQPRIPVMTVRDPPPDDHLAGERDRVAPEIAGACDRTTARLHEIAPHTPRRLRCHDAPPISVPPRRPGRRSKNLAAIPGFRGSMAIVSRLCGRRNGRRAGCRG